MHLELIAFLAGLISSTAAIPQIVRMIRTRKTSGVSTFMFLMKNCSCSLWVLFGIYSMTYSIIFWNVISLALCTTVLVMKYRIQRDKAKKQKDNHNVVPMFLAIDNTSEPDREAYIAPKPAITLVYSRPKGEEVPAQQIMEPQPQAEQQSPAPQA